MSSPRGVRCCLRFIRPKVVVDVIGWLLLAGLPFAIHGFHLLDVPIVDEPFDVDALGHVEISAEDNACSLYRQAADKLVTMGNEACLEYADSWENGRAAIGEASKAALADNQAALALFREASERPDSLRDQAEAAAANSINSSIRNLARLVEIEALLLQEAGDVDSAWSRFYSILRCGRHLGRNSNSNGRLIGRALHVSAIRRIVSWAESPQVDAALLERALGEAREIYRLTPPMSAALKLDYLWCRQVFDTPALQDSGMNQRIFSNRAVWECRWLFGEPELSRTVVRATFANWLSQCDKPPFARPSRTSAHPPLFSVASEATAGATLISPQLIESLIYRTLIARQLVGSGGYVMTQLDTEQAWQALLELTLALQIHYRETGAFPESPDDLMSAALDALPIDPFGLGPADQGATLRYRSESDPLDGVTIWSVGPDGIDDDGRLQYPASVGHDYNRGDILISVKPSQ